MPNLTRVVIALGGNALQESGSPATAEEQLRVVTKTCETLADISCQGYEIAIVHGNGPQVGRILLASEYAKDVTPAMPFDVCGAMSQGYIGYHIQQSLRKELHKRNRHVPVATIVTQVVVDKDDEAFKNPTKPIGLFYSKEESDEIARDKGFVMKEDSGRGWRRVVPSPMPKAIVEVDTIERLWSSTIVIMCGGGGIPVIEDGEGGYTGVAAVIDKDLAAERLAEAINADILLILTEVEKVAINFNKPDQKNLSEISCDEAKKYMAEGHFAPGSMLPKVKAAVMFAESKPGRKSIITSLYSANEALKGESGTLIR
ncbi:MAG: carbamate kinase [Eubacteriales bacterium]|nr:carbamate kinase [Eubacteriales bacterium]